VSASKLARRHGRTADAIYTKAYKLGLPSDPFNRHQHPRVAALLARGLTWATIADLVRVPMGTVRSVSLQLRAYERSIGL
jgi:hypothetical protein